MSPSARCRHWGWGDGTSGDDHGCLVGIGEAFAERLAADGWDLVLVARRRDRLEQVAARLKEAHGASAVVLDVDLANPVQLEALCAESADLPLGMLVNNAALAHYMPFATLPAEQAQELVQLDVLAPVMLTRAVLPGMVERGQGAVINVVRCSPSADPGTGPACRSARCTRPASRPW